MLTSKNFQCSEHECRISVKSLTPEMALALDAHAICYLHSQDNQSALMLAMMITTNAIRK